MIIDSVADKIGIDISKLTVPDVRTEFYPTFDPKTEIGEEEWDWALGNLLHDREVITLLRSRDQEFFQGLKEFGSLAAQLKFFFPERVDKLPLNGGVYIAFLEMLSNEEAMERLEMSAVVRYLFPGSVSEIAKIWSTNVGKGLQDQILLFRRDRLWHTFMTKAVPAKQFLGEGFVAEQLSSGEWDELRLVLNSHKRNNRYVDFVHLAAKTKLVFPERKDDLGTDRQIWQRSQERLAKLREMEGWKNFFELAYYLTILAADEAKITSDGGIEVVMPKQKQDLEEKIPEMPVKRAF